MSSIPQDAEQIQAMGSSVDFFKTIENGLSTYYFDTSKSGPPAPMVNAMAGLQLLDENSKLVMINHKNPGGLFPKIQAGLLPACGRSVPGRQYRQDEGT